MISGAKKARKIATKAILLATLLLFVSEAPDVKLVASFLEDHNALFRTLLATVVWDESMYARKTASFGVPYNYVQMRYAAAPLHPALLPVAERLREHLGFTPNNCLLNHYETGDNSMGFHADDTSELEPGTGVAILSLGSAREITFRKKNAPNVRYSFALDPGSLLYMDAAIQESWKHAILKQMDAGPRISLTWRAFRAQEAASSP